MPRIRTIKPDLWRALEAFGGYEWSRLDAASQPWWIYFMQGDDGGPIKIGRTRNLRYRLSELCGGYPFGELGYAGILRGPAGLERELHSRFANLRIRFEWFRPETPLVDFVLSLAEPT
jgi:hypothetical protein